MFEKIKEYYDTGAWDFLRVYNVVGKAITPLQFEQITGEKFEDCAAQEDGK